jgi:hypothetical protein
MKNTTLGLILVLFASACSHKTESNVVTDTPQFVVTAVDVSTASVQPVAGNANMGASHKSNLLAAHKTAVVDVVFTSSKTAEFQRFTQEHLNQKVQILVGSQVLPVISTASTAIASSKFQLAFSTPDEAQAFADSLTKK